MSVAYEYLARTGIMKDLLHYPCSLFLNHFTNKNYKKIITIKLVKNKIKITHWNLHGFKSNNILPKHENFYIAKSKIFISEKVIVPEFELLKFTESKYKTEVQRTDSYFGKIQECEYDNFLNTFLNPKENTKNREKWLWIAFLDCHNLNTINLKYKTKKYQMTTIFNQYGYLKEKWFKWFSIFQYGNNKNIASELLFAQEYRYKAIREQNNLDQIYKKSKVLI